MMVLRRWSIAAVLVLVVALAAGPVSAHTDAPALVRPAQGGPTPADLCAAATADLAQPESREFEEAEDVLQDGVDYWAVVCTEEGAVYLDLYEELAPMTVNNFVFLAEQGYYNTTTFHRVLPGFMAQGGDPTASGSGGPGYQFGDETDNGLAFDSYGLLAMANAGAGTNGSQFFITYVPTSWLDGNHTIFGKVYSGMDALERLNPRDPQQMPSFEGAALDTVLIVDDPANVSAEPDPPPSMAHFQYLLDENLAGQIQGFDPQADSGFPRDLEAEVAALEAAGGAELGAQLRALLTENGFAGAAGLVMPASECPASAEENPVWQIDLGVADYGSAETAQAVTFDDARGDALVASGVFDEWREGETIPGRLFVRQNDESRICGESGVFYRFEFPYGRYVLTTDLVLDGALVTAEAEPTPEQFLAYVTQEILFNTISGTLERGNATQ